MKEDIFSRITHDMRLSLYILVLLSIIAAVTCIIPVKIRKMMRKPKIRVQLRRPRPASLPCHDPYCRYPSF